MAFLVRQIYLAGVSIPVCVKCLMAVQFRVACGVRGLFFLFTASDWREHCRGCSCGLAVLLPALWLSVIRTERMFLQSERKGKSGGARLQENSLICAVGWVRID